MMKWKERIEKMKVDGVTIEDRTVSGRWNCCAVGEALGLQDIVCDTDEVDSWLQENHIFLHQLGMSFTCYIGKSWADGEYRSDIEYVYKKINDYVRENKVKVPPEFE